MTREELIEEIEKIAGALLTVPYHLISTDDLKTICYYLKNK